MVQGARGNVVAVSRQITGEACVDGHDAGETCLLDLVADVAVEAFDHAVGLRTSGRAQAVLDAQGHAGHIEHRTTRGRPGFAGEVVVEHPRARAPWRWPQSRTWPPRRPAA